MGLVRVSRERLVGVRGMPVQDDIERDGLVVRKI